MKVITRSPPPTSPTKGDDLCEIDGTNVAMDSLTLLISLCGLAGNGAVLWLIRLNPIMHFIFNQAVTDFLFLIFAVPSTVLFLLEELSCSTIVPLMYLSFLFQLSLFSYIMGLYRVTFISIERCRSILCPFFCGCQLPERLSWVVVRAMLWAFFIIIAFNSTVTSLCQSQEQRHCRVALISIYTLNLLLFATPMVISSTILFIHFKSGSQQQQSERLDIVVFLAVLFTLPLSLCNFLQQLGYTAVSSQVVFLLSCFNSSIKPFIYFLVGSWRTDCCMWSYWGHCFRERYRSPFSVQSLKKALQRVFEEPEEITPSRDDAAMDTEV